MNSCNKSFEIKDILPIPTTFNRRFEEILMYLEVYEPDASTQKPLDN